MKKFLLLLIPVVLLATTTFILYPYSSSKALLTEVKSDPKTEMVKKIAKMIKNQPRFKRQESAQIKPAPVIEKKVKESQDRVMATSLRDEIKRSIKEGKENIRIVLNTPDDNEEISDSVINAGGRIIRKRPGFIAVEVPADKAEQLIMGNSSIGFAWLPFKFYPSEKISEGVNLTGANIFNNTIYRGAGVKVAVVDVGFKGLSAAIAAGELPLNVITQNFSDLGLETEHYHGTACAEIVHDMAPEAELHLVKIGDEIGGYEIIDYLKANNIDIVSLSISTFGSGPGDGTGYLDEAFDELRDAGILVVASAGNYGNMTYEYDGTILTFGSHWEGIFIDNDNDEYHEYKLGDINSYYNVLFAIPDRDDDGNPSTSEVSILLRWDSWPFTNIDYDMELYTYNYTDQTIGTTPVKSSTTLQTGTQPPVEYISLDVPDSATDGVYYALKVKRREIGIPIGTKMEIYLGGGTSQFIPFRQVNGTLNNPALSTLESSISEPADAESVMAVGAIDYIKWLTGPQEEYSSQGPTNDWNGNSARIKPDIMGTDGVTTFTYGDSSFSGTSAAAPHVAGMAALILSSNLSMTPDELQETLEASTVDMGTSGKDNLYGYGRLQVKDTDNDGIIDENEDKNHNGIVDSGETSPTDADTDNDGMPDGWEMQYGLNPVINDAAGDMDNDSFTNLKEYKEGTLPNDRNSRPKRAMPWLPLLLDD